MAPRYPEITVPITGADPHLLAVLGRCQRLAREGGLTREQIRAFAEDFVDKLTFRSETKSIEETVLEVVGAWFTIV